MPVMKGIVAQKKKKKKGKKIAIPLLGSRKADLLSKLLKRENAIIFRGAHSTTEGVTKKKEG